MDIQGDLKDQMNMHYFAVVNIVICGCEFESRPGEEFYSMYGITLPSNEIKIVVKKPN
jgi:hypothetical protein